VRGGTYLLVVLHGQPNTDPESAKGRAGAEESGAVVQHLGAGWGGEHDCGSGLEWSGGGCW
jgi:hypothetical protein